MAGYVDEDAVAFGDQRDRTTVHGLRSNVSHAEPVGSAGEPAIGDERSVATPAGALHGAGNGQHLAHARTPLGPLVADDHDVAGRDASRQHGLHGEVLAVKHPGTTIEPVEVQPGHLDHGTLRRQRAPEDGQPAHGVDRIVEGMDDLAIRSRHVQHRQVLGHGVAGHGDLVAVEDPLVQEHLHHHRHPADPVDVDHVVLPVRLRVGQMWDPGGHPVEILQLQLEVGLEGHCHEVQHGVRGTSKGHDHGNGVLERTARHDLAREDAQAQQVHHGVAAGEGDVGPTGIDRRRRGRTRKRHSDGLTDRRHGVGREHPRTAADGRTGGALDRQQLVVVDVANGVGANGLEHAHDVQLPTIRVLAGHDRTAVYEHRREVHPGSGHEHSGQRLVATGKAHKGIQALGVHDRLHRVGNDLTAHQAGPHALVTHGDAVADRDRVEREGEAAGLGHPLLATPGQVGQRHVARGHLVPR